LTALTAALTLVSCGSSASSIHPTETLEPVLELTAAPARRLPPVKAAWSYNIGGTNTDALNAGQTPNGSVISVDLLDVSSASIGRLNGLGKYVICYYSAGTSENYRTDSQSQRLLAPELNLGEVQRGSGTVWEGEKWLDIRGFTATATGRAATLRSVMSARLDLARAKGCAAVEPDNVDAYANTVNQNAPSGTPPSAIKAADQLAYNRWTADAAHARGLSVLLKNDLDQVSTLAPNYDGALNESCFGFVTGGRPECDLLRPFTGAGKAIYVVEYHPSSYATAVRKSIAAQLHLNVILTDENVERLNPYARFGTW